MSKKDIGNLAAILDSAEKILNYVDDLDSADELFEDSRTFDAVLMNFINIGEAVGRLTDGFKNRYTGLPWSQIKKFRNIVAHNYFGVDAEEVWQIIESDIANLVVQVKSYLDEEE